MVANDGSCMVDAWLMVETYPDTMLFMRVLISVHLDHMMVNKS